MLDAYKTSLANQYEAVLRTLQICIDRCPDEAWDAPVVNLKYCQVVFHTLFFTDFHLGPSEASFRDQPFHRDNKDFFRDYEELEDRKQVLLYDRPSIEKYLEHCRNKASQVIASETAKSLCGPSGFPRREFSRAELHTYTIRHIQHHSAQLSLRLRIDWGDSIPWVGSGWDDVRR